MPLLFTVCHASTPNSTNITSIVVKLGVFGSLASTKEVVMGFIKAELLVFRRIAMLMKPLSPFAWWAKHEQ